MSPRLLSGVICILGPMFWPLSSQAEEAVDLELVLAVDVSGSIDYAEARLQRDGYVAAIADPEVVGAIERGILGRIAVTYVEWAGDQYQKTVVDWTMIHDEATARGFAAALQEAPLSTERFTSISAAIDHAVPLFEKNGFEGTRRVIDVSGDGPNNVGRYLPDARDDAVEAGVTINGLPIMAARENSLGFPNLDDLDRYYKECVIGGPGAFIVVAKDFEAFAAAIRRKMILEVAGKRPPERPAPLLRLAAERFWDCEIGERQLIDFLRSRDISPF